MTYIPVVPDRVDAGNSSIVTLAGGATFTGVAVDTTLTPISAVTVFAFSDKASATNGFQLQWSQDNVHWADHVQTDTVGVSQSHIISDKPRAKWYRVNYINGAAAQGVFRLQTLISITNTSGTVRDLETPISSEDEAQLTRSIITGKDVITGVFHDVDTDSYGDIPVIFGPPASDAFGRARVANPQTLFNVSFEYDMQSLLMQTVNVGAGTATKTANVSSVTLTTGGTTNTDGSIFQSKQYLRYEPGKSLMIPMTGVLGVAKTNVRSGIGYYDANNGMFFDQNNGLGVTLRSSTSGSPVDTFVAQINWNIDKMNGSGPSGITLDMSKAQIFFIDLQWLSEGSVRFGFIINRRLLYCHQFDTANLSALPYNNTACLPIRWEIHNTGVAASTTTLEAGCAAVISEGGNDIPAALSFTANNGATPIAANARRPILSIQVKTTFNSITNRSRIILKDVSLMAASNPALYELVYNGALTGASFASVDANSGVNSDVAATAIAGGTVIDSGYCPAGSLSQRAGFFKDLVQKLPITLNAAGATGDIISVVISGISGAASTTASLTWSEER